MPPPAVILIDPQLGENIGACARAMWNCGLDELRLVRPRDGWPSAKAVAAATGAAHIVEQARLFLSPAEATADLRFVVATTARRRAIEHPISTLVEGIADLRRAEGPSGLLFGPERTGLDNDALVLAQRIVTIPVNPKFTSLNLAQAVLLVAHAWWQESTGEPTPQPATTADSDQRASLASGAELVGLFEHLEQELDAADFFRVAERRPGVVRNLRTVLQRAELRSDDVSILHGVISALVGHRKDGKPVRSPRQAGTPHRPHQEQAEEPEPR
jgi:tRNA/rRNA methyltransferase